MGRQASAVQCVSLAKTENQQLICTDLKQGIQESAWNCLAQRRWGCKAAANEPRFSPRMWEILLGWQDWRDNLDCNQFGMARHCDCPNKRMPGAERSTVDVLPCETRMKATLEYCVSWDRLKVNKAATAWSNRTPRTNSCKTEFFGPNLVWAPAFVPFLPLLLAHGEKLHLANNSNLH